MTLNDNSFSVIQKPIYIITTSPICASLACRYLGATILVGLNGLRLLRE